MDYDNQDNDNEFYDNDDNDYNEDEAYVTLRSGKTYKVPTIPTYARKIQELGQPRPNAIIVQSGQVFEQEPQQPKKNVRERKKMQVEGEGEYETKRTKGKAQVDNVKPYSMVEIIGNTQAPVSIAQLLKDLKNQRELREFIKRTLHMEITDEQ